MKIQCIVRRTEHIKERLDGIRIAFKVAEHGSRRGLQAFSAGERKVCQREESDIGESGHPSAFLRDH